jgi:polyphosphate glucokinase
MRVLVVDVGGSHVKVAVADSALRATIDSSDDMTPQGLIDRLTPSIGDWAYEVVSIGYPGHVDSSGPVKEPGNLGSGWVGFDYAAAFGKPVRLVNDAVMQALGAYHGGRMLFLGLGTGLGSALVSDRVIVPLELGELRYQDQSLMDTVGRKGLERLGEAKWREAVLDVAPALRRALLADYLVLGGGNAARVGPLPEHTECGGNEDAIEGGQRLWRDDVEHIDAASSPFWRVVP